MTHRFLSIIAVFMLVFSPANLSAKLTPKYQQLVASITPEFSVSPFGITPLAISKNLENLTTITGAYYDREERDLVILGISEPGLPKLRLDDFTVALRAMHSNNYPAVSIDPGEDPNAMDVSYWGETENTHFGYVMFEADRLLKTLSMGKDNVTLQSVAPSVEGFNTYLQRSADNYQDSDQSEAWFRMWFEPNEVQLLTSDDKQAIMLKSPSMIVKTEYLPPNDGADPNAEAFVKHINENYPTYGQNYPVLLELKQLEQWLLIAKWMRDNQIPIDLAFLNALSPENFETPAKTPTITVEKTFVSEDYLISLSLYGGVDFTIPKDNYQVSDAEVSEMVMNAKAARTDSILTTWGWRGTSDETQFQAVAMSPSRTTRAGSFVRKELDLGSSHSIAQLGFTRYYDSFSVSLGTLAFGWKATPFELSFPDIADVHESHPRQITIRDYDSQTLQTFTLSLDDITGQLVYYSSFSTAQSSLTFTEDGSYILQRSDNTIATFDAAGKLMSVQDASGSELEYFYKETGQLDHIQNPLGEQVTFEYNEKNQIIRMVSPDADCQYTYDTQGDLITVSNSNGYVRTYTYDKDHRLTKITDEANHVLVENEYDPVGRITLQTLGGRSYILAYDPTGRNVTITNRDDPNNYRIHEYDELGRLTAILQTELPAIHYSYKTRASPPTRFEIDNQKFQASYNWQGNLIQLRSPALGTQTFNHNIDGNITSLVAADGKITNFQRNENGTIRRLVENTEQLENEILFQRDTNGQLQSIVYANGEVRSVEILKETAVATGKPVVTIFDVKSKILVGVLAYPDGSVEEIEWSEAHLIKSALFTQPELLVLSNLTLIEKYEMVPEILAKSIGSLVSTNSVVVMSGDAINLNYKKVFPNQTVIHARGQDVNRILRNTKLTEETILTPANTVIFNGTPNSSQELEALRIPDEYSNWQGINPQWTQSSNQYGYPTQTGAAAFNEALQNSPNVIVIIAHADGNTIYWPDGTQTTSQDIDSLKSQIEQNQPLVLLFGCQTARLDGMPNNIVDSLLNAGARGVFAPRTDIAANENSLSFFQQLLLASSQGKNIIESFRRSEIYIDYRDLEFWVRGLETLKW